VEKYMWEAGIPSKIKNQAKALSTTQANITTKEYTRAIKSMVEVFYFI